MIRSIVAWFRKKDKSTFEQYVEGALIIIPLAFLIRTVGYGLYVVPSGSMETTMLVGERFIADKLTIWFTPLKRGEVISLNDPTFPYSKNAVTNWYQRYVYGPSNWTKRIIGIPGDHVQGKIEEGRAVVYLNDKKLDEPYVNQYPLIYTWSKAVPTMQDIYLRNCGVSLYSFDVNKPYDEQPFYRINPELVLRANAPPFEDAVSYSKLDCWLNYPDRPSSNGSDLFDVHLQDNEYWVMGDNRKGSCDSRAWGILDGKLIHGRIKYRFFSYDYNQHKPWSFWIFDQSWIIFDLLLHPFDFWKNIRWSRCFGKVV